MADKTDKTDPAADDKAQVPAADKPVIPVSTKPVPMAAEAAMGPKIKPSIVPETGLAARIAKDTDAAISSRHVSASLLSGISASITELAMKLPNAVEVVDKDTDLGKSLADLSALLN